jgi:hypothetical protein
VGPLLQRGQDPRRPLPVSISRRTPSPASTKPRTCSDSPGNRTVLLSNLGSPSRGEHRYGPSACHLPSLGPFHLHRPTGEAVQSNRSYPEGARGPASHRSPLPSPPSPPDTTPNVLLHVRKGVFVENQVCQTICRKPAPAANRRPPALPGSRDSLCTRILSAVRNETFSASAVTTYGIMANDQ